MKPSSIRQTLLPVALGLALAGCSSGPAAKEPDVPAEDSNGPVYSSQAQAQQGPVRSFSFVGIDGKPVTDANVRGRFTVIGFGASYDVASQAQARFLNGIFHTHTPRVNVLLLVLESHDNLPLVQAFADGLGLDYPIAFADDRTIAGEGPFEGLGSIPSVVILDREGREVWRKLGIVEEAELSASLRELEAAARP